MRTLGTILVLFFFTMQAQPPAKFYTTFGGNGDDIGYSGKQTLDGHYIIAGSTTSFGNGYADVYLVKLDSMGTGIWQKYYGGFGNDVGKSVIQLPDSGYVIAGFTNSFGAGGYDAYLIRTDKNGNMIWQRTFGGLDWDFANDLVQGSDKNIYMVGNTSSFGNGKKDGFVVKFDTLGNQIFQKFIGGAENEELRSIIKTNDNFLATVGYTESKGDIDGDGYFLKLDLNGDTLFTRKFGGPFKDFANDVVQKSGGNYVMAGAKTYTVNGYTESLMYTLSSTGDSVCERHLLKTNENESFVSVANSSLLPNITAFTRSIVFSGLKRQGQIFTMHPNGFEYQINESGGVEDEFEYSIEATKYGGYINVGSTRSFGSIGLDVYFIKRDSVVLYYNSIVKVDENIQEHHKPLIFYSGQSMFIDFSEQKGETVEILGIDGKLLSRVAVHTNVTEIDLSEYPPSIYLVRIRLSNGQFFHNKFVTK